MMDQLLSNVPIQFEVDSKPLLLMGASAGPSNSRHLFFVGIITNMGMLLCVLKLTFCVLQLTLAGLLTLCSLLHLIWWCCRNRLNRGCYWNGFGHVGGGSETRSLGRGGDFAIGLESP
jgi:hypothetical protein